MKEVLSDKKSAVFWGTEVVKDKTVWFPVGKDQRQQETKSETRKNSLKL